MFLHYTVYSWDKTKCRKSKRNILRNLFVRLNLIFSKGYFTERKCWAKYFKATLQYVRFSDVFITDVFGLANIYFFIFELWMCQPIMECLWAWFLLIYDHDLSTKRNLRWWSIFYFLIIIYIFLDFFQVFDE